MESTEPTLNTPYAPDSDNMLTHNLIIDNKSLITQKEKVVGALEKFLAQSSKETHCGARKELEDLLNKEINKKQ